MKNLPSFGLYDTLDKEIPKQKLSDKEKVKLIKSISQLKKEWKEAILLLICEHALRNEEEYKLLPKKIKLPYGGDIESTSFEFDDLPHKLQWIIYKFNKMNNLAQ
jgi:hypothetical protein